MFVAIAVHGTSGFGYGKQVYCFCGRHQHGWKECVMAEKKNGQGRKMAASRKSLFKQITKGDLVAIHDEAGERKGRAASREYGNWVLVL